MIHVLVVEDDEIQNKTVCTYLNDHGHTATGCLNYDAMYNFHFVYDGT